MCRRTTQPLSFACPTPPGSPSPPATTDLSDLDDDLPDDAADFDDLLFDPLLSDEPIDLAAVRADDALIDALGGLGGLDSANDAVDPDDPLIAMLAAWAASARPETARPDTAAETTATGDAVPLLRSVPEIPADEPVGTPTTAVEPAARMDQPTVRLSAPARPAEDSPTDERDDSSAAPAVAASGSTAPVIGLLSRARALRRRSRPGGRPLPSDHPLRRAAVAVVVAALGISGAAASGGTAVPGDPAWAITKVFFAERARSIEAAAVVHEGLERARIALSRRQPEIAKQELAAIAAALPSVREEEGHTQLVDQQRMLEAVVALTPPLPVDPNLTSTATPTRPTKPGTSVLAEAPPSATDAGKDTPPVAAQPADPAPAAAAAGSTDDTTAGGTTDDTTAGGSTAGSSTTGSTGAETDTTGTEATGTTGTGAEVVDPAPDSPNDGAVAGGTDIGGPSGDVPRAIPATSPASLLRHSLSTTHRPTLRRRTRPHRGRTRGRTPSRRTRRPRSRCSPGRRPRGRRPRAPCGRARRSCPRGHRAGDRRRTSGRGPGDRRSGDRRCARDRGPGDGRRRRRDHLDRTPSRRSRFRACRPGRHCRRIRRRHGSGAG